MDGLNFAPSVDAVLEYTIVCSSLCRGDLRWLHAAHAATQPTTAGTQA